jgi:hypothetical protein
VPQKKKEKKNAIKKMEKQVAHACNPSYSGGRDQKNHGSKPTRANSFGDPISKTSNTKRAGGVAQGVGPEFKPRYHRKKKGMASLRKIFAKYTSDSLYLVYKRTFTTQ